ncbi:MAG: 1-acyl-sn-glycerol-3-phosphate acyltransferase [Clostridia bacterium]|nr:1-acyl-sn-glycerol-3-phosphate acyltransferase [Clostridia bacterium]
MAEKQVSRTDRFWFAAQRLTGPVVKAMYNIETDVVDIDGPFIVIANHTNNLDPLFVAYAFPKSPISFVASEHIFRLGFVSKLLEYFLAPIPRKKASSGADTVKACLRATKAGRNVGLMAEGEASWNGITMPVFSATGKLVKSSGASLVTMRIEGGYLTKPRWAEKRRRGKIKINVAGIYSPEELEKMSAGEVLEAITNDIYYNCWEHPDVAYVGTDKAAGLPRALFICPRCGHVDSLEAVGDTVRCFRCGATAEVQDNGTLKGTFGPENIAEWDKIQFERLKSLDYVRESEEVFFSDKNVTLKQIGPGHKETVLGDGFTLHQMKDRLVCGMCTFLLDDISNMAMTQAKRLLFSYKGSYYEIKVNDTSSMRKYLAFWQNREPEDK